MNVACVFEASRVPRFVYAASVASACKPVDCNSTMTMLSVPSSSEYLSTNRPLAFEKTMFAIGTAPDQQNGMWQSGRRALESFRNPQSGNRQVNGRGV